MMKTLYDLLEALPKDHAEDLRTAFRKAVKGVHPDLHPDDPDAALKFREIVRANEILSDAEQRAAYDHLLVLAHLEQVSASKQAAAARLHRFASGMMAVAGVSIMTAGSYLLFMQMSAASLAPADKPTPTVLASASVDPSTTGSGMSVMNEERSGIPREAVEPYAILPKANAKTNAKAIVAAKQIERPHRVTSASMTSDTPRVGPAAISSQVTPLPRPRPPARDPSREESVASMRLR